MIDSLVLHSPLSDRNATQETGLLTLEVWRAMERLVAAGGVRQLGISNCYDVDEFVQLYRAAAVKPAVLQNRLYRDTGYDTALRAFCRENNVRYQSFWTLTANPHILARCV